MSKPETETAMPNPRRRFRRIVSLPLRFPFVTAACVAALGQLYATAANNGTLTFYAMDAGWLAGISVLIGLDAVRIFPRGGTVRLLIWITPAVVFAIQLLRFGFNAVEWDSLWLSIWLALAIAWQLARGTRERIWQTVWRLAERKVLIDETAAISTIFSVLDQAARRWALIGGLAGAGLFVISTPPSFGMSFLRELTIWPRPFSTHAVTVLSLAFAIGAMAGLIAAYGRFGKVIRRQGLRLRVIAEHGDHLGGLRPVGALFWRQSLVVAVPIGFLGVWLALFTGAGGQAWVDRYGTFFAAYLWLVLIPIFLTATAFVLPMLSVHSMMLMEKATALLPEADVLSRRIEEIRQRLLEVARDDDEAQLRHLDLLVKRFKELERAPTWPVDASILGRFAVQNVGLLFPLIGYLLG